MNSAARIHVIAAARRTPAWLVAQRGAVQFPGGTNPDGSVRPATADNGTMKTLRVVACGTLLIGAATRCSRTWLLKDDPAQVTIGRFVLRAITPRRL